VSWRSWVIPPAISHWAASRNAGLTRFDDSVGSWSQALVRGSGYDSVEILAQVQSATEQVLRGEAVFERDSILFHRAEYRWPILAGLLSVAARDGALRVLDFGGSLGSVFWQHREFLHALDITWGVVEQSDFVSAGKSLDQTNVEFFATIVECLESFAPNVILLSSVLQYLPQPGQILQELLDTPASTLILDRTPMCNIDKNIVSLQVVPEHIYSASYPAWIFSHNWLIEQLAGWDVVAEFEGIEPDGTTTGGTPFAWNGLVAKRLTHG